MNRHKVLSVLIVGVLLFTAVGTASLSIIKMNEQPNGSPETFEVSFKAERDRYGNCVAEIDSDALYGKGYSLGDYVELSWDSYHVRAIIVRDYIGLFTFEYFINVAKDGIVTIACQFANGSLDVDDTVKVAYMEPSYRSELMPNYWNGKCGRQSWMTDEDFCNFRNVKTTGIREGVLYRTSDAFPDIYDIRADAMNNLFETTDIIRLVDMNETMEELGLCISIEIVNMDNIEHFYYDGMMFAEYMSVKFLEDLGYAEIFTYIADNEGPYAFFCTLGKDRTGFVMTVLEALMGATYDEMLADYNRTYVCLYNISEGSEEYNLLFQMFDPILVGLHDPSIMENIEDVQFQTDVKSYDFQQDAERYLTDTLGLSQETVDKIRANLCA